MMRRLFSPLRPVVMAVAVLAAAPDLQAQQCPGGPPPSVIVESVASRDVADRQSFIGRVQAIDKVAIRARVDGFINRRGFEDGAEVATGQVLFELEKAPYEAAVALAEANLANAKATLQLAKATEDRVAPLAQRGTASQATLDEARAKLAQGQADVRAQEANLKKAQLDLDYATIRSPMDGRAGGAAFAVGEYVSATSNPLVTIVRQDPMYIAFPVPQRTLLEVRREGIRSDSVTVRLRLSDGSDYEHEGVIKFAEVESNAGTDTVTVRAQIPNPRNFLVDQQLVNVTVMSKAPDRRLLMSQSAVLLDQTGAHVLAVTPEKKIELRRVELGGQRGPNIIVLSGLEEGDRVVVSGHQKVRPGMTVEPHEEPRDPEARGN
jgi:membrane fusion protein (multidrug efflux system)